MPGSRPQGKLVSFAYEGLDDLERETVLDKVTLLEWQRDPPFGQRLPFMQAQSYCEELVLDGHDDWRLPTRVELDTILDPDRPVRGATSDSLGSAIPERVLWSATASPRMAGYYLIVTQSGTAHHDKSEEPLAARCVRWTGPPRSSAPRYTMRGTPTEPITHDERTGLDWQQKVPSESLTDRPGITLRGITYQAAVSYCETLAYGGHDDWRLPNIKEAVTLFDPGQKNRLSPEGFPGELTASTWTTSEDPDSPGWYWFSHGDFYVTGETVLKVDARCVR